MGGSPTATARRLRERAGPGALLARAPGRVNLVGEHTDYNDGFVLPVAIDRSTWVAARPRDDAKLVLRSDALAETVTIDLAARDAAPRHDWSDYPHGLARALLRAGARLRGADLSIASEVPLGAGLSSSAALLVAVGRALLAIAGEALEPVDLAARCREAENEFVGARSGIMDPMVALLGRRGAALLLDCRSLAHRAVALPAGLRVVVCNSLVRHDLAAGGYNRRRAECEEGVAALARANPAIAALRDATALDLDAVRGSLDPVAWRRCRHVVAEKRRVPECAAALESGDLARVAALLADSHASLRDDFEVSCPELDLLVEAASELPGVHGSRMTGGGFGGCTVNLVEADAVDAFRHRVAAAFRRETGRPPEILVCEASAGAAHDEPPS
ncbi:MAG: galactokinase [Alphaproteobacteria bacterium]